MTQTHCVERALVALLLTLGGSLWSAADAQTRRPSPDDGPLVERAKDDFDARVPYDAPAQMFAATLASGDQRIDALLSAYKWATTTVTYSFYEDSVFGGAYYGSEIVSEASEPVKTNVRAIMAWLGTLMNVTFVEVTETSSNIGLIRIMRSSGASYAYAYYPASTQMFGLSGDVHLNPSYDRLGDTNGFQHPAGAHGYTSLIHEIGHAVGLKHPHDGSPNLASGEDNHSRTVMSYNFLGRSPGTPMAYDLLALHYLYGARSHRTGNDTYVFSHSDLYQYRLGTQLFLTPTLATEQTIWDSGGYNVLDLSTIAPSASGYRLDLNPLGWLTTGANYKTTYLEAGTVIGPGVSIRKLVNSSGNDTVYANAEPNVFAGYSSGRVSGADVIHGASGDDTIDLSGYTPGEVSQTASGTSGNDLLLNFGSNGSVLIKNYSPNYPAIVFGGVVSSVSIGDVAVAEGNVGSTTVSFAVTLSAPAPTAQSVSFSTMNGSALVGSDYVAAGGVLTFAAGETLKSVTVTINGDTAQEVDENFFAMLSAPSSGLLIADGQGAGTILNDDLPANLGPVAVATATPSSGFAPLTVAFVGSASYDPDGSISSYSWAFGDGTSSSLPSPSHIYIVGGTYTATLTVTDNRGATSALSLTISAQQNPNTLIFVGGITMQIVSGAAGSSAQSSVSILRSDGQPAGGATVTGKWTGLVKGVGTATTDANGRAVFNSKSVRKRGTITFTVTGVSSSGYVYDASRNIETSDSVVIP